jgi:uroporphyrin-III C-methyltransferase/precorrin-2 dehydrogenase/sirohydrochlorin ferrochelatase
MRHYPAFMDIERRPCLVIGGGAAALAKLRLLRRAGALVTIIAPDFDADIRALRDHGRVTLVARDFRSGDIAGHTLVHAASGNLETDEAVSRAARAVNVPVNVVDGAKLSSFIMPAIVDRGALVIGISSGGASPILARRVRAEIEKLLPHGLAKLAHFAQHFRSAVRATYADFETRLRFWENFFDSPLAETVMAGEEQQARTGMLALVNRAQILPVGDFSVLEIDPLEADLLTLRDVRRIARADLLLHDGAITPAVLDHAQRDTDRIEITDTETDIKLLTAAHLRAGKRIVYLQARGQIKHTALSAI